MITISSVGSISNSYPITNQGGFDQIVDDFNSIGSDLQSGNVSSAQTALAAFQQGLQNNPQASANQPFGENSQANTDYQSLVGALQTGNLSNAQKAFESLQTDLQSAQAPAKSSHGGHHHHHGSGGASASTLINSLTANSTSASSSNTSTSPSPTLTNSLAATSAAGDDGDSGLNATA